MLPSMLTTLIDELNQDKIEGDRRALTVEQVQFYNLPTNPNALKLTDSRAKKYMQMFGDLAVELDAIPPAKLEKLIEKSIEETIDITLFNEQYHLQEAEREELRDLAERLDDEEES